MFGNIFRRKQRILSRLEGINRVFLEHENVRLEALREILWGDYALVVQQEEAYWYQQAKSKWVQMGDKNTHFFHQATVTKRLHNRITALRNSDNGWVYADQNLLDMVVEFYKGLYSSTTPLGPVFPCSVTFPILKDDDTSLGNLFLWRTLSLPFSAWVT